MNNGEYDKEVHKLLYHISEMAKIHAKLIESNKNKSESNDNRIHRLEKDFAVLSERMKNGLQVNEPHVDTMFINKKRTPTETAKDYTVVTLIMSFVAAAAKILYDFIIK